MNANGEHDRFPSRKSPRLKQYDYTTPNCYFVTICTREKRCLFWHGGALNKFGEIAKLVFEEIGHHFPDVIVDKFVVMPNHVHGILVLRSGSTNRSAVIGQYKSYVSKKIHNYDADCSVWQASFHDHVIRNQKDYQRIWLYIEANPARGKMTASFSVSENNHRVGGVMTPPYGKEIQFMEYITNSPEETENLGAALGSTLTPGAVIAYRGGLGAGKTAFTRGLARGLGCNEMVTSPTYTIVNEYLGGRLPLFHFDMYRLGSCEELWDIGWEDYLERGGVCAVEWSENVADAMEDAISVTIEKLGEDTRRITIEGREKNADFSL